MESVQRKSLAPVAGCKVGADGMVQGNTFQPGLFLASGH